MNEVRCSGEGSTRSSQETHRNLFGSVSSQRENNRPSSIHEEKQIFHLIPLQSLPSDGKLIGQFLQLKRVIGLLLWLVVDPIFKTIVVLRSGILKTRWFWWLISFPFFPLASPAFSSRSQFNDILLQIFVELQVCSGFQPPSRRAAHTRFCCFILAEGNTKDVQRLCHPHLSFSLHSCP